MATTEQHNPTIYQHVSARRSRVHHLARIAESLTLCGRWVAGPVTNLPRKPVCNTCRRLGFPHDAS